MAEYQGRKVTLDKPSRITKGEAGYGIDQDGKTFKIHEPAFKTKERQEKAAMLEHLKSLVEQQNKQKTYGKPKLRLIKGGKDAK